MSTGEAHRRGDAMNRVRKELGETLRRTRRQRGLSQNKLGRAARLSGKFIGEVERGDKSISIDSLARIDRALGVRLRLLVPSG